MITLSLEQRSPEWYAERCGVPTSSNFDKIVTTKGEPSKQRTKYLYQLAGEIVTGKVEESYQSQAMLRGIELEEEARLLYDLVTGNKVDKTGLCFLNSKKQFASSPDGLIGDDGLLEIKCPSIHTQVDYLLKKELPSEYFQQVQGQMLVTGRAWVDFFSYYPGLKPLLIRVNRDEEFIKKLETELTQFCKELKEVARKIS